MSRRIPRFGPHRRLMLTALAAWVVMLTHAPSAPAAQIVTWEPTQSRFVDPSAAPPGSYNEPPGIPERANSLRVNVYLPDGYRDDRRWPVLYLLHGQGDAFDSWAHPERGDLLRTAAGFPGIIVMPEGDRGFYANWWNGGARGGPAWERYHLEELIDLVNRRLPIRQGRRWHAIAGLSMGGEGAMFYASQRPGYFGSAASFSGPLSIQRPTYQQAFNAFTSQSKEAIFGDPSAQEFYWSGHNPIALVENLRDTRLYVAAGNGVPDPNRIDEVTNVGGQLTELELSQHSAEFVAAARAAGLDPTYAPHQGIHAWRYWREDLANAIDWGLFAPPPSPQRQWTYRTVAQRGAMWGLRYRFAEPPAEVITFTRSGRRLTAQGAGTVTLRSGRGCRVVAELPFDFALPRTHSKRCVRRASRVG